MDNDIVVETTEVAKMPAKGAVTVDLATMLATGNYTKHDVANVNDEKRTVFLVDAMADALNADLPVMVQKICLFSITEAAIHTNDDGFFEFACGQSEIADICGTDVTNVCKYLNPERVPVTLQQMLLKVPVYIKDGTLDRKGIPHAKTPNWFYSVDYSQDEKLHLVLHPEVYAFLRAPRESQDVFGVFRYWKIRNCRSTIAIRFYTLLVRAGLLLVRGGMCNGEQITADFDLVQLETYFKCEKTYKNRHTQFAGRISTAIKEINKSTGCNIADSPIRKENGKYRLQIEFNLYDLIGITQKRLNSVYTDELLGIEVVSRLSEDDERQMSFFEEERTGTENLVGESVTEDDVKAQISFDTFSGLSEQGNLILSDIVKAICDIYNQPDNMVVIKKNQLDAKAAKAYMKRVEKAHVAGVVDNVLKQAEQGKVDLNAPLTGYYISSLIKAVTRKTGRKAANTTKTAAKKEDHTATHVDQVPEGNQVFAGEQEEPVDDDEDIEFSGIDCLEAKRLAAQHRAIKSKRLQRALMFACPNWYSGFKNGIPIYTEECPEEYRYN